MIPLFKVKMNQHVAGNVLETLYSGYIGEGKKVDEFEKALIPYIGKNVLALNSCTSAIQLALRLCDVKVGDEVITKPMTCTATNMPILAMGAKIVWADVYENTGNINVEDVKRKITNKTKAIICVHWGGNPCDLEALSKLNIPVIQDAAHAFGARYRDALISKWSHFTCFSFQAIKHLTTVDGGALVCKNIDDYKRGKLLRWYGIDREQDTAAFRCGENIKEYGYKFHMNDVTASIGLAQLKTIDDVLKRHRDNGQYYLQHLYNYCLSYLLYNNPSFWLMTLLVPDVDNFISYMKSRFVMCSRVHNRNDIHDAFKEFKVDNLKGVDEFYKHQVSIPVGWWVDNTMRKYIVDTILEYI